jgi:hypothetical protein
MDPEDNNTPPSIQMSKDLKMDNDKTPSLATKRNSPYREALQTPIQLRPSRILASSISRPQIEEIKKDSAKEFDSLCTIMTEQNSMMISKLEQSLEVASEQQSSQSADHTVNAILAMTKTLVSVFQDTNNKMVLPKVKE